MTAHIGRFLRRTLLGMFISVLGGGVLIWLAGNGLDLQQGLAELLSLAQQPEYRLYAVPAVAAGLIVTALFLAMIVMRMNRPPRSTARALRRAVAAVQQQALAPLPDPELAQAACDALARYLHDLEPYESTARRVREVLNLAHGFLLGIAQGEDDLAALHDKALEAVDDLMRATQWAAEDEDLEAYA